MLLRSSGRATSCSVTTTTRWPYWQIHPQVWVDYLMRDLVREADVEGQVFGERPHFERPGCQPDPDDPYTTESVRSALSRSSKC